MTDTLLLNGNGFRKKSEKLASAIFLVSNLMSDNEILKAKLRSLGLDIVSICINLDKNNHYNDGPHSLKLLENRVSELLSFLNISFVSGLISDMNASILRSEFEAFLRQILDFKNSSEFNKTLFTKEFFGYDFKETPERDLLNGSQGNGNHDGEKDRLNRKDQRNRAIINLISKKGEVNIKDISVSIKGCSEKTIQRELNTLIQKGAIRKIGERRWSRYSLA